MRRRSKLRFSKTRIRAHFRRIAEYEIEDIDRFRELIAEGHAARGASLDRLARRLPVETQELLADDFYELDAISMLADQLAIVALYRIVELITGRMLAHKFGQRASRKESRIDRLRDFLKNQCGIDLKTIPHFRAIDELRLLNNSVKHEGRASRELAQGYPRWKQGDKLAELDEAFVRLRVKVPAYIFRLAQRMKLRYT